MAVRKQRDLKASAQLTSSFLNPCPWNSTPTSKRVLPTSVNSVWELSQTFPEDCPLDPVKLTILTTTSRKWKFPFEEEGSLSQKESPELVQSGKPLAVYFCKVC